MYFVRTPYIIKKLFPKIIWDLPKAENKIYLTFDDGPHPEITPWIIEQLKQYNAKASFFCLGKNAEKHPEIVKLILENGHTIGNHGYAHLNGWQTNNTEYVEDVLKSNYILNKIIDDNTLIKNGKLLFRPAYGKIRNTQISQLKSHFSSDKKEFLILNWTLMPGDFDQNITSEQCYKNLTKNIKSGDIIVLHDNEKSWKHLQYCLPKWLKYYTLSNMYIFNNLYI
jgi:peptidoglycan/xylan/chitin deacetylase (PgdA/CDA1 family)